MYVFAQSSAAETIIVGSEEGMLHRLRKENPGKTFLLPSKEAICPNMKLTTLKKVYLSLLNNTTPVTLPESIRRRAERATVRMMAVLV